MIAGMGHVPAIGSERIADPTGFPVISSLKQFQEIGRLLAWYCQELKLVFPIVTEILN